MALDGAFVDIVRWQGTKEYTVMKVAYGAVFGDCFALDDWRDRGSFMGMWEWLAS